MALWASLKAPTSSVGSFMVLSRISFLSLSNDLILAGTFDAASFAPMMNTTTSHCPGDWMMSEDTDNTTAAPVSSSEVHYTTFNHLGLYDISYLWYGPLSLLICVVIGALVSLTR